ncbi:MAG TPA: 2-phospho-L-lactate guanylyltransferase [Conexibacter sp.]|nr:2-phospho-L-lactate guanylyltransferase [Conexibacter sp.]
MQTVAILPVKRFASAKRRLEATLPGGARRALAEAMFSDVLTGLRRVASIDEILVVSADPGAQRIAEGYGARAVEDPAESGQDQAVLRGAGVARELGAAQVLCLAGDCPLLDPAELETLLGKPRTAERFAVIVADRHGTGTNALLLSPPDALEPRYGPGSFQRHLELAQAAGVPTEVTELASLALDVDTPDDLAALQERLATSRGGAAHTRGMLHQLQRTSAPSR